MPQTPEQDEYTAANDSEMGQILQSRMNSRFQSLLFNYLYEAEDIDGMTLWGSSGQPQWHADMMSMVKKAREALGEDGLKAYAEFRRKKDDEIYNSEDDEDEN